MAKNVRVSDALYELAELEARLEHRSIAQQLEYWARHGMAVTRGAHRVDATAAATAATRLMDIAHVRAGKRSAETLHFVPRAMVEAAELEFPKTFRRG
jgi:hypothetical protein